MEGGIHNCRWSKKGNSYYLSCTTPVKIVVSGIEVETAVDELRARILDFTGDGECVLQFDRPLPEATEKERFKPGYFELGYNDCVDWIDDNKEELFTDGVCKRCGTGLGLRTDVPRIVTSVPRFDIVGFSKDPNVREMISERVFHYILPLVKDRIRYTEVRFDPKVKRQLRSRRFFEIDFTPDIQVAVPKLHDPVNGWRCPRCRTQVLRFTAKKIRSGPSTFVIRSMTKGHVLLLGRGPFRSIGVSAQLHKRISGDTRITGLTTDRLVMIDSDDALSEAATRKFRLPRP